METEEADSLIGDFYSSVILLSLLNPLKNVKRPQGHLHAEGNPSVNAWRCFLDDLSFLLDYQSGGKTVTAIAVEHTEAGPVFWVATTQSKAERTMSHIRMILKLLRDIYLNSSHEAERLSLRIAAASIDMSKAKVKNYRNIMTKVMDKAISSNLQPSSSLDESLFRDLKRLIDNPDNDFEQCDVAYNFRYTKSMSHLNSKITGTFKPELWYLVRHYIGRLGFWFKASKRIVEYCRKRPLLLNGFFVERCPSTPEMTSPGVEVSTKLQDVLRRMLPGDESVGVAQRLQNDQAPGVASISEQYASKSSAATFRPRIHAEIALLEYFFERNLRYLDDDKYIGCSKASCYCCNLYFKYHPAGLVPRPCHGNVWCQWSIPTSATEGVISLPRKTIIRSMIDSMTTDLSSFVNARPQRRMKPPDSTTEISSRSSYSWR